MCYSVIFSDSCIVLFRIYTATLTQVHEIVNLITRTLKILQKYSQQYSTKIPPNVSLNRVHIYSCIRKIVCSGLSHLSLGKVASSYTLSLCADGIVSSSYFCILLKSVYYLSYDLDSFALLAHALQACLAYQPPFIHHHITNLYPRAPQLYVLILQYLTCNARYSDTTTRVLDQKTH